MHQQVSSCPGLEYRFFFFHDDGGKLDHLFVHGLFANGNLFGRRDDDGAPCGKGERWRWRIGHFGRNHHALVGKGRCRVKDDSGDDKQEGKVVVPEKAGHDYRRMSKIGKIEWSIPVDKWVAPCEEILLQECSATKDDGE